jgi:predicted nucleic-acid-binding Zn-ribbon protein
MDSTFNHLNQAIDNANQVNNTYIWVLFTFVVIAPIGLFLIILLVKLPNLRKLKCPKCGNMRYNKVGAQQIVQTVEGNKTITTQQRAIICSKCKNEFAIVQ